MRKLEPTPLTIPLSWIYGAGAALYHGAFDAGIRKPVDLGVPVLSIGNLVVGGTGKTPIVLAITRTLLERGMTPAILSHGYGGSRTGLLQNGHWENGQAAGPEGGDEPLHLSLGVPTVTVGVGKDRAASARRILEREHVDVFLLDDGFQHRQLERQANVLLLDVERPFGNGHLVPAGPLREPPAAIRRATALLLTGGEGSIPPGTKERLRRFQLPAWTTRVRPLHYETFSGETAPHIDRPVIAVAGIARPERFYRSLESRGLHLVSERSFPDHHVFTVDEIGELEDAASNQHAVLVTTGKDAIRLLALSQAEGGSFPKAEWFIAVMQVEVDGGWEAFLERILPQIFPQKKGAASSEPLPESSRDLRNVRD